MPKQRDIRTLVDQFVSKLSARVREQALDTVRAALGGGVGGGRRGPGRPRKGGRRGPARAGKARAGRGPRRAGEAGRRSREDVAALAESVLAHVRAHPGQRLEEIGRELGMPTADLKRPIANLLEAGSLRTEGQKRGTRYYAGGGGRGRKAGRKTRGRGGRKAKRRAARKTAARPKRAAKKARRALSPEQRAALLERLAKARAAKLEKRAAG